mmetsp:Transcript_166152/g.533305  ORF Transcript_166152/g.533305 Transcript_166152/m.533305 type:complete len:345 (+) Transcript_166152:1232-2266(+)
MREYQQGGDNEREPRPNCHAGDVANRSPILHGRPAGGQSDGQEETEELKHVPDKAEREDGWREGACQEHGHRGEGGLHGLVKLQQHRGLLCVDGLQKGVSGLVQLVDQKDLSLFLQAVRRALDDLVGLRALFHLRDELVEHLLACDREDVRGTAALDAHGGGLVCSAHLSALPSPRLGIRVRGEELAAQGRQRVLQLVELQLRAVHLQQLEGAELQGLLERSVHMLQVRQETQSVLVGLVSDHHTVRLIDGKAVVEHVLGVRLDGRIKLREQADELAELFGGDLVGGAQQARGVRGAFPPVLGHGGAVQLAAAVQSVEPAAQRCQFLLELLQLLCRAKHLQSVQ